MDLRLDILFILLIFIPLFTSPIIVVSSSIVVSYNSILSYTYSIGRIFY